MASFGGVVLPGYSPRGRGYSVRRRQRRVRLRRLLPHGVKRKRSPGGSPATKKRRKIAPKKWRYCNTDPTLLNSLRTNHGVFAKRVIVDANGTIHFPPAIETSRAFLILLRAEGRMGHAISAILQSGTLYVFDPHGRDRDRSATNRVARLIARRIGKPIVRHVKIYGGPSLQARNTYGICTGFAHDFLILQGRNQRFTRETFNNAMERTFHVLAQSPNKAANIMRYHSAGRVPV